MQQGENTEHEQITKKERKERGREGRKEEKNEKKDKTRWYILDEEVSSDRLKVMF